MTEKRSVGGMEILTAAVVEIVLHGVLAGDQRQVVGHADVVERLVGADQLGHLVGAVRGLFGENRIAPAEVVQTGDQVERAAHRHVVAQRLVNGIGGHVVGVDVRVAGADAVGRHHPLEGVEDGAGPPRHRRGRRWQRR